MDVSAAKIAERIFSLKLKTIQQPAVDLKTLLSCYDSHIDYYNSFVSLILEEVRSTTASAIDTNNRTFNLSIIKRPCSQRGSTWMMEMSGYIPSDFESTPSMNVLLLTFNKKKASKDGQFFVLSHSKGYQNLVQSKVEIEFSTMGSDLRIGDECFDCGATWEAKYLTSIVTFQRMYTVCTEKKPIVDCIARVCNPLKDPPPMRRLPEQVFQLLSSLDLHTSHLNDSQTQAIRKFLSLTENTITLLQGPPGTGKTTTITTLVRLLARLLRKRVLVCAPSNKAVLVLAERLYRDCPDVSMVFVGVEGKVSDVLLPVALHSFGPQLVVLCTRAILAFETWLQTQVALEEGSNKVEKREESVDDLAAQLEGLLAITDTATANTTAVLPTPPMSLQTRATITQHLQTILGDLYTLNTRLQAFPCLMGLSEPHIVPLIKCFRTMQTFHEEHSHRMSVLKFHQKNHRLWEKVCHAQETFCREVREVVDVDKGVLAEAQVIFCTLSVAGRRQLIEGVGRGTVDVLVVDEAGQSVEAETLIPLQHFPKQVLLVGDTKQLPATVTSRQAKDCAFHRSMMERLEDVVKRAQQPVTRDQQEAVAPATQGSILCLQLTTQYRMHPSICAWPSARYYDNALVTAKHISASEEPGLAQALAFYDIVSGRESAGADSLSTSRANVQEAQYALQIVQSLVATATTVTKIGIITFYAAQVALLQRMLNTLVRPSNVTVVVNTVDGFQGDECDVILLSFVCSNTQGNIGFLQDCRRLNVAITRAKQQLIMLGHVKTLLAVESDVKALIDYLQTQNRVFNEAQLESFLVNDTVLLASSPNTLSSVPSANDHHACNSTAAVIEEHNEASHLITTTIISDDLTQFAVQDNEEENATTKFLVSEDNDHDNEVVSLLDSDNDNATDSIERIMDKDKNDVDDGAIDDLLQDLDALKIDTIHRKENELDTQSHDNSTGVSNNVSKSEETEETNNKLKPQPVQHEPQEVAEVVVVETARYNLRSRNKK